jgi:protease-4
MRKAGILGLGVAALLGVTPALGETTLGWIEMEGPLAERPAGMALFGPADETTLLDMIGAIEEVAARDDLNGMVLRLRSPQLSTAQIQELGDTMLLVRETGKPIVVFSEIYGPAELLLASYADQIIMQTGGSVSAPAVYMEEMFLADALRWIGVEPSFVQIGDYKGAEEMYANSQPSEAWNANIDQLLDSLYDTVRETIALGRDLSDRELEAALQNAFFMSGESAIEHGLIDAEVDRLDLDEYLREMFDDRIAYNTNVQPEGAGSPDFSNPFALLSALSEPAEHAPERETIAILHIDGAIIDGDSTHGGAFSEGQVGAITIRKALKQIEDNDLIEGVIIRINSPGGSAIASENIWQGVRRVAEKKPVWVSVGNMAASGGYYIAVSGDKIYMDPSSIVGSIGVVAGKFGLAGLYDKLHINVVQRSRGPQAGMLGALEPWTPSEKAFIRERMKETYDLFESRVLAGRPDIDIENAAEGRLFTANKAIELGMADEVGGLKRAIYEMADELALAEGDYDVMHYPAPPTFEEMIEAALGGFIEAPGVNGAMNQAAAAMRALVGERAWPGLRDSVAAMLQMRTEPVLLISPKVLLFR